MNSSESFSARLSEPGLSADELASQDGDELPERLAMSVIDPCTAAGLPAPASETAWDNAPVYSIQPVPPEQEPL